VNNVNKVSAKKIKKSIVYEKVYEIFL